VCAAYVGARGRPGVVARKKIQCEQAALPAMCDPDLIFAAWRSNGAGERPGVARLACWHRLWLSDACLGGAANSHNSNGGAAAATVCCCHGGAAAATVRSFHGGAAVAHGRCCHGAAVIVVCCEEEGRRARPGSSFSVSKATMPSFWCPHMFRMCTDLNINRARSRINKCKL
jgi:hypothetical protein